MATAARPRPGANLRRRAPRSASVRHPDRIASVTATSSTWWHVQTGAPPAGSHGTVSTVCGAEVFDGLAAQPA